MRKGNQRDRQKPWGVMETFKEHGQCVKCFKEKVSTQFGNMKTTSDLYLRSFSGTMRSKSDRSGIRYKREVRTWSQTWKDECLR